MNNTGVIDRFLDTFTTYIDSGFGLLGGEVAFLTATLIVIDITLAGLFWAWGADEDVIQIVKKRTMAGDPNNEKKGPANQSRAQIKKAKKPLKT